MFSDDRNKCYHSQQYKLFNIVSHTFKQSIIKILIEKYNYFIIKITDY